MGNGDFIQKQKAWRCPRTLVFALLACFAALPAHAGLWGTVEFKANSLEALPQWLAVLEKTEQEQLMFNDCDDMPTRCASPAMLAWRSKLRELKTLEPEEQLQNLNTFANQWSYRYDSDAWGKSDYWASPGEFLRNSGDCEDYAILKYVSLKELGFAPEKMRIAVVRDTIRNLDHAVLVVRLGEKNMVMDSLFNAVLADTEVTQYQPHYSVNEFSRWAHIVPIKQAVLKTRK